MPNYQAVSFSVHGQQCWRRYTNYAFASRDAVAALTMQEVVKAAMSLPLGFVPEGESFTLVAVQGLASGSNVLVGPDGRWRAAYIPAVYRSYPFQLAKAQEGQTVLCVDVDSGLLLDSSATVAQQGAEAFFVEGAPAPAVQQVMQFLQTVAADRLRTAQVCAHVQALELLEVWPIVLKTEQGEQRVEGLYRISEARFNALPADALKSLQDSGGLALAVCQLLSMQHLSLLAELARQQLTQAAGATPGGLTVNSKGELDLEFLHQADTLNFGNL